MRVNPSTLLPDSYAPLLAELKTRVHAAQVKAVGSVNRELILLYWHIGREILRTQKAEGWGMKVVERLAKDLAAEFPEMDGFSPLNLKRMRAFYAAWATSRNSRTARWTIGRPNCVTARLTHFGVHPAREGVGE